MYMILINEIYYVAITFIPILSLLYIVCLTYRGLSSHINIHTYTHLGFCPLHTTTKPSSGIMH